MKVLRFDLKKYIYEDFHDWVVAHLYNNSAFEEYIGFFLDRIERIPEDQFTVFSKANILISLVVEGTARKDIPLRKRIFYVEVPDAAFIIHYP